MNNNARKQGQAEVLTKEQIKRVIQYQQATRHSVRNICLLHMSIYLGCRVGELAALTMGDVFTKEWKIREQIVLRKEYCKGNKTRTLYLSFPGVQKSIMDYGEIRKKQIIAKDERLDIPVMGKKEMKLPFILTQIGGAYNPAALQQLFTKMYSQVGLGNFFTSHSGRRTFITNLISSGIDLKSVSTLAGHSSINTTVDVYAKSNPIKMADICKNITIQ